MKDQLPISEQIRAARLAQHLTQVELGELAGCTQPVISNLEKGATAGVSEETLKRVREALGLSEIDAPFEDEEIPSLDGHILACCCNSDCPLGATVVVNGKISVRPAMFQVPADAGIAHCMACGGTLDFGCPDCSTPWLPDAGYCVGCGRAMVEIPKELKPKDPIRHAEKMAARRAAYQQAKAPIISLPGVKKSSRLGVHRPG